VTDRVFWDGPYLTSLDAQVVALHGNEIPLRGAEA
jgi:hypothetical protein